MSVFDGRPDLLLLFIAQIAFIMVQILIYLRIMREEKSAKREHSSQQRTSTLQVHKKTKTAKRKWSRRQK